MSKWIEKLQNLTVAEVVTLALTVVMCFIGIVSVILTVTKSGEFERKKFTMESQVTQLNGELSLKQADNKSNGGSEDEAVTDDGDSTTEVVSIKGSAQGAGSQVAKYQNRYIPMAIDAEDYSESNAESRASVARMLAPYFDEESQWASQSWYNPSRKIQYSNANSCNWSFECNYSFFGSSLPVIWLCRSTDTNDVYAYTTATYDPATKLFSNVHTSLTIAGRENMADSGLSDVITSDDVESVIADRQKEKEEESVSEDMDWLFDEDSVPDSIDTVSGNDSENNNVSVTSETQTGVSETGIPDNFFQ